MTRISTTDGRGQNGPSRSWAAVLGSSLPRYEDKNVLEVVLEKDSRGGFIVSDSECLNLIRKLGLDTRPGIHIEGVQNCPNGRGVIYLSLKKEVDIGRYCRHEVFDVTANGIRAVNIKPAGKREVVVTIRGLHPNTRDNVVINYLSKFGEVTSSKVIHGVYSEGPLKGMKNGDRNYKLNIKSPSNLGSYHVLDGTKVTIKFSGQQQTCARCLKTAGFCKGRGIARRCETEGGEKADFVSYILDLWKMIGYSPDSPDEVENILGLDEDLQELPGGNFTPSKTVMNTEKYAGVSIKQFPADLDHGEIIEFLIECGMPADKRDSVSIHDNGAVMIRGLDNELCLKLISVLHMKQHYSRRMFCNGVIPLTPEKVNNNADTQDMSINKPSGKSSPNAKFSAELTAETPLVNIDVESASCSNDSDRLAASSPTKGSIILKSTEEVLSDTSWPSVTNLVRRHSLSILNRTPEKGSLAEDLLATNFPRLAAQTKLLSDSIKDLTESVSNFNSCQSSLELSTDDESEKNNKANRKKGKKRACKTSPNPELQKKANMRKSPPSINNNQ